MSRNWRGRGSPGKPTTPIRNPALEGQVKEDNRTYVGYWPYGDEGVVEVSRQMGQMSQLEQEAVGRLLNNPTATTQWRGSSGCRVCGVRNGSRCFSHGEFVWPEGYWHYVLEHGVRPPQEMIGYATQLVRDGWVPPAPPYGEAKSNPPHIPYPGPPVRERLVNKLAQEIADEIDGDLLAELKADQPADQEVRSRRMTSSFVPEERDGESRVRTAFPVIDKEEE